VKITLIYLLALSAVWACRRANAAVRCRLCMVSLGAAILTLIGCYFPAPFLPHVVSIAIHSETQTALLSAHRPLNWLTAVWIAGAALVLLRFLLGLLYLQRQAANLPEIQDVSGVKIRLAPVTTPLVWGWRKPSVLLPLSSAEWTEERRRMAILHEQAHIKRGDHGNILLTVAAQALYWFHPLTWSLAAKLHEQQELACDEHVLANGVSPARYAEFLLELSRQNSSRLLFGCAMVGRFSQTRQSPTFRGRIMNILNFTVHRKLPPARRRALVVAPALLMAAAAFLPSGRAFLLWSATNNPAIYTIGGDVKPPVLISKTEPQYTKDAKDKKIEGVAVLSIVVDAEGNSSDVQVQRSLDSGLDQMAMEAIHQWRFAPATRNGEPVAVKAAVEVHFQLL
jgi:TonB family protein